MENLNKSLYLKKTTTTKSFCLDFSEPNPRITPGTTLGPDRSTDGLGGFHVSAESGHVSARPLCFHEPLSLAALRPT